MKRAKSTHYNMIENLAPFTAALIAAFSLSTQRLGLVGYLTDPAIFSPFAIVFVVSRLLHFPFQISNVPLARTLCFFGGTGATLGICLQAAAAGLVFKH